MYSWLHHCMKPKTNKIKKSGISHQMFKNLLNHSKVNTTMLIQVKQNWRLNCTVLWRFAMYFKNYPIYKYVNPCVLLRCTSVVLLQLYKVWSSEILLCLSLYWWILRVNWCIYLLLFISEKPFLMKDFFALDSFWISGCTRRHSPSHFSLFVLWIYDILVLIRILFILWVADKMPTKNNFSFEVIFCFLLFLVHTYISVHR